MEYTVYNVRLQLSTDMGTLALAVSTPSNTSIMFVSATYLSR